MFRIFVLLSALKKWVLMVEKGLKKNVFEHPSSSLPKKELGGTKPFSVHIGVLIESFFGFGNDPSAGSPTETLLRLLLPLNDQV